MPIDKINKINIIQKLYIPLVYKNYKSEQEQCIVCDTFIHAYCYLGEFNQCKYEYYQSIYKDKSHGDYKYFVCNNCISFNNTEYDTKLELIDCGLYCKENCLGVIIKKECSIKELCGMCIKCLYFAINVCEKCLFKTNVYNNKFYICTKCYNIMHKEWGANQ